MKKSYKIKLDCHPCDELPLVGEFGKLGKIIGLAGFLGTGFSAGVFGAKIEKLSKDGYANIVVIQNGVILSQGMTDDEFGDILINGNCATDNSIEQFDGGCLIATATYGSEMATQVLDVLTRKKYDISYFLKFSII